MVVTLEKGWGQVLDVSICLDSRILAEKLEFGLQVTLHSNLACVAPGNGYLTSDVVSQHTASSFGKLSTDVGGKFVIDDRVVEIQ